MNGAGGRWVPRNRTLVAQGLYVACVRNSRHLAKWVVTQALGSIEHLMGWRSKRLAYAILLDPHWHSRTLGEVVRFHEPRVVRIGRGLGPITHPEFGKDSFDVGFDRPFADEEDFRNVGVGVSSSDELEDTPFPGG